MAREFVWGATVSSWFPSALVGVGHSVPEPVAMIEYTDAGDIPATGTVTAEYPSVAPPEVLHYLRAALGSVVGLTSSNGEVVERYVYDPYGRTHFERPDGVGGWTFTDGNGCAWTASAYGNPWMWTGQRYDAITRQYHFWARTYSPHLGRWLQRDPLEYVDGVSLYEYVGSIPISYVDLFGLTDRKFDIMHERWDRMHLEGESDRVREEQKAVAGGAAAAAVIDLIILAPFALAELGPTVWLWAAENPATITATGTIAAEVAMADASPNQGVVGAADDLLRGGARVVDAVSDAARTVGDDVARVADDAADAAKAAKSATGQQHLAISKKVADALDRHPNLKGKYTSRDPGFVTQAKDAASHRGYQKWHRDLDDEVVEWLDEHQDATQKQFEKWLRDRYNKPDLKDRFPNGCP